MATNDAGQAVLSTGSTFRVTFVECPQHSTEMRGPGRVEIDARGVRFVGPRRRINAAFYGACASALASTVAAFWIAAELGGRHLVASVLAARPLVFALGLGVFGALCLAHAILIRVLPLRREDRHVPFSTLRVDTRDAGLEIVTTLPGFAGTTSFAVEGGPSERARFLDELETARAGGARSYRTA
ncbi:MAG: hypothetical protein U0414_32860 [Polyangiaceae bacterium]